MSVMPLNVGWLFSNGIADLEARKSVAADNFSLWQRMEGFLERKKQTAAAIGEYHNFLCEMHDRFFYTQAC